MQVKIKKLIPEAVIPKYSKSGDAGMDLVATSISFDESGNVCYGTGLAFEIPEGYVGLIFPRSSNSKKDLILSNSVGVLDSGYRGEVSFKFKPSAIIYDADTTQESKHLTERNYIDLPDIPHLEFEYYAVGDRIGQIIILPYPQIEFEEVEELSETDRGEGGFGSTGK
jgi:dUTP pyrophosphatase